MSDAGSLIPISDEQAKAVQEVAKATQEALKALEGVGDFLREVLGTTPADLVGYLGGDWLTVRRAENLERILNKARERLRARNVKPEQAASLSLALPILIDAANENRDELQEIWARLLAAAADPARAKSFRLAFIEAAKQMDPLDAFVLQDIAKRGGVMTAPISDDLSKSESVSRDEIEVSVANLVKLELAHYTTMDRVESRIMPFGREFLRTVAD